MALEDRGKSEESKYKHEQEVAFKVRNRRNKLFGMWIAETHLGKNGEDALNYAKDVVMADFERPGDDDVFEKVREDLDAAKVEISDHMLRKQMELCDSQARAQVMSE
ncbi:MAG: DUF1476 domain-containing protein [Geminicoccaceae bacterium]|nr:DUF1476 domain-containing protein [Geminicoccaceae bacterium]MCB9945763.1 DUF1476 domain-containing protein [Geminicoccaceae bacterium]